MYTRAGGSRERFNAVQLCSRARVNALSLRDDGSMQCIETFSGAACFHVFWLEPRCEELKPIPFEHLKAAPSNHARRRAQILYRPEWHDPGRVYIVVGVIIVPLNVVEIDGLSDSRLLIEIA
jgi:hypothetical protein